MYDNGSSFLQGFDDGRLGGGGWSRLNKKVRRPTKVEASFSHKAAYKPGWAYDHGSTSLRDIRIWTTHFFFFSFFDQMIKKQKPVEKKKKEGAQ